MLLIEGSSDSNQKHRKARRTAKKKKKLFSSKSLGMGGVWKGHGKKGFQAIDFFFLGKTSDAKRMTRTCTNSAD